MPMVRVLCPHCGTEREVYAVDPRQLLGGVDALSFCRACHRYLWPAEVILVKRFDETSPAERLRVALEVAGVRDLSYDTQRRWVRSYEGSGTVRFADGRYLVTGAPATGDAHFVADGRLRWRRLE